MPQLAVSRPRICVLLHRWIDNFWLDFSDSPDGIQRRAQLDSFIANRVAATLPASAESLKQLILKVRYIYIYVYSQIRVKLQTAHIYYLARA